MCKIVCLFKKVKVILVHMNIMNTGENNLMTVEILK